MKYRIFAFFSTLVISTSLCVKQDLAAPGDLYVSQTDAGTILKFRPDGTKTTFISGLDMPRGLAFDRLGNLFVSAGADQLRDILKITPSGEVSVFASGFSGAGPLALDGAENLYVGEITNSDAGSITKVTPDGTKTTFGSFNGIESGYPLALAFSANANLYVTVSAPLNLDGGVVWFEPGGTGHTFAFTGGSGLAFNTGGDLFEAHGTEVIRFTLSPYAQSVFVSGFEQAGHLAFDLEGNLFVADATSTSSASIFKVSPDGTKTTFASG
nr:hypothetical protein [Chthoniobacterales bacterium]